jgi:hypothetical protein
MPKTRIADLKKRLATALSALVSIERMACRSNPCDPDRIRIWAQIGRGAHLSKRTCRKQERVKKEPKVN